MFIVIVGAAVAGIIGVISVTTQSSADPMIRKQALAIAEAVLEEVRLQPFTYCDPDDPSAATASSAGASVTFLAAAQAGATTGNLTINKPAGTVQNHVMIASVAVRPHTVTVTPPSGWTQVRRIDNTVSTTNSLIVYRKVAGAGEPANYTWTLSAHTGAVGNIASFSGVDTASPVNVENGQVWTGAVNMTAFNVVAPSVTTTVAGTMLVTSYAISSSGTSGSAWTPPAGMTEAADISSESGTTGESIEVSYAVQAAAGATGTKTATVAGHDDGDAGAHILALKPGAGCPVLAESIGPEPSETRYSTTLPFDNVNDYHGFDSNTAVPSGIRNIDGTLIAGLEGYRVTVSVTGQALGGIGNDANGNPQSLLIGVTVAGPGNTTVTLHGYRTRYAPNDLP